MSDFVSIAKESMNKAINFLEEEYKLIKVGRANPRILDKVFVDYYGAKTPVNQVASINVDARSLVVKPWDGAILREIEREIQKANLGITPQNDGEKIRLNFPQLNHEERLKISKQVSKVAEDAKIAIRNARRDVMSKISEANKAREITDDEANKGEKQIQDLTNMYNKKIDSIKDAKIEEVMEV